MAGSTYAGYSSGFGHFKADFRKAVPRERPGTTGPEWTKQYAAHESLLGKSQRDSLTRTKRNNLTGQGFSDILALKEKTAYSGVGAAPLPGNYGKQFHGLGSSSVSTKARRAGGGAAFSLLQRNTI